VGLFSVPLRRRFRRVTAIESGASAAADLSATAEGIEVARLGVDEYLAAATHAADFVLADPPRSGLGKTATRHLLRLKPAKLHIVACDPATLARDLAVLLAGGYALQRMFLVDLFPQTYHLETVVHLATSGKPAPPQPHLRTDAD
jgi:23S rRNA (uracil1939-C5)-methyltransferase